MNEKQSPVIRLDLETNEIIEKLAAKPLRTKVGVIRWLLERYAQEVLRGDFKDRESGNELGSIS